MSLLERFIEVAGFARAAIDSELWRVVTPAGLLHGLPEIVRLRGIHPGSMYTLHAGAIGDRVAVVDTHGRERRYTFAALNDVACRFASALSAAGVGRGDRVVMMLGNGAEFAIAGAACAKLRAGATPVSYRLTGPELAYILRDAAPAALVYDDEHEAAVLAADPERRLVPARFRVGAPSREPALAADVDFDDALARGSTTEPTPLRDEPELILYTSGTTGRPKGAVRALKGSSVLDLLRLVQVIPLRHSDVHLVAGPLYHALAGGFATIHLGLGASVIIQRRFQPEAFLAAISKHRVTTFTAVPTMLRALCEIPVDVRARYDLTSLRAVVCSGAALEHALVRSFAATYGPRLLYNLYGATELGWVTVAGPEALLTRPNTIGRAVPGCRIALRDDAGREVAQGEIGELFVQSEMLVRGYHKNPEATAGAKRGETFGVGDLARRDADGYLFIAGRKVDMVVSGGVNVYPAEIEAALAEHPDVTECAVIGVRDERWGEALRAFVTPRDGSALTGEHLEDFLRPRLAGFKIPRQWRFVSALPRNPTGKVLKGELPRD